MKSITLFILTLLATAQTFAQEINLSIPDDSNIVWFGEMHGTQKNYEVAFQFMEQMANSEAGLHYYLIESGKVIEIKLNNYLKDGTDSSLNVLMSGYKGTIGYAEEKKALYKKMHLLYQTLPQQRRFRAVSIDVENNPVESHYYLRTNYLNLKVVDSTLVIARINSSFTNDEFFPDFRTFIHIR